jgi:hypothetical protein
MTASVIDVSTLGNRYVRNSASDWSLRLDGMMRSDRFQIARQDELSFDVAIGPFAQFQNARHKQLQNNRLLLQSCVPATVAIELDVGEQWGWLTRTALLQSH